MITLVFAIDPVAKERARVLRNGRSYTPAKTANFERTLAAYGRRQMLGRPPFQGPLSVSMCFFLKPPKKMPAGRFLPSVRPDLDNYVKAVKDAMNGVLWIDDGQVCHLDVSKVYDLTNHTPRIQVSVREIQPDPKETTT